MTGHRYVTTGDGLPNWTNPISHAVVAGDMCFVSGQLSVNAEGDYVTGTIDQEARRAFDNFFAALNAAGFAREDIVFVDIAFADLAELATVNAIYAELFDAGARPARTVYQVAKLPFDGRIKVMGTAVRRA